MSRRRPKPEILQVQNDRVLKMLERADRKLSADDADLMRRIVESYDYLTELVEDKNTSIARLRKLMFGAQTEKSKNVTNGSGKAKPDGEDASATAAASDNPDGEAETSLGTSNSDDANRSCAEAGEQNGQANTDDETTSADSPSATSANHKDGDGDQTPTTTSSSKRSGHGRLGADAYQGAKQVDIQHSELSPGDACPECDGGTLYEKTPSKIVHFVGQPPLDATIYQLQKLRCHLCGKSFVAETPPQVKSKGRKYDTTAASMIGLLRYGTGLPFNRLQRLQRNCQVPLPASTQWDVVLSITPDLLPAYSSLIESAAQGQVLHNDDTTIKILELMEENRRRYDDPGARTGIFTSGVVSVHEGRRIALFFSGRQHAGENLRDVLQHRAKQLAPPIQMSDGLSRNLPKEFETILSNCMAHARRKFVELHDRFSDECEYVLEALKKVYHNDKLARKSKLSPTKRLRFHRIKSQQTMERLHRWLEAQINERRVEPNSALGEAITYMLKRWEALTLFLREPGAPLDNNIVERALKKAITHRKNSLFYRTERGAFVGDLMMSLIHTCELNGANPLEYLTALQEHADEVAAAPSQWLPWNYQEAGRQAAA